MIKSHMYSSKVTYPSDHADTWGHVINERHCVFFWILTLVKKFLRRRLLSSFYNLVSSFIFCISFINLLTSICVDRVVLKIWVLNQEKKPDQYYSKIPDQEFKSWSTKYLKPIIKNKSWCIHDFFEPVSNNTSSIAVIAHLNILIFWLFI